MGTASSRWAGRGARAASSAQPFPRRSARLRPHPSKPCAVLERLLSPRNLWQIPFGARTQFKNSHSPLWRSPQGQQQVGSLVGAYLGCGRIGVHLTPRENTLGHFGLNLVTVSSLRCGAQRCIPFTPYFTFDHWIPKYRQTRTQLSDARTDLKIFGVFCGGGLTPLRFAEQVVFDPSR